ncbi:MAG: glycosyltransferase [Chitinivibrionales bacterium]|nr:glycosyltransferase [Chitinivibrionales bacterium]
MLILIVFSIFISAYYLGAIAFLRKGLFSLSATGEAQSLTYSIIIAAHNEEKFLGRCLDSVFSQTLPADRYEVFVVNDRSTDKTEEIARRYAEEHPGLKVLRIEETPYGFSPKKYAVIQGVNQASHDVIVYTDADCIVPSTWLETIDRNFTPQIGLIQGHTSYIEAPQISKLFWNLQSIDFLSHGVVSAGGIGAGLHINSNANNFAFRKEAFDGVGGYGDAQRIISGDDDLLLQRLAKQGRWQIHYMSDPAGAVKTYPCYSLVELFEQRKRWGSKSVYYNGAQISFLTGIFLFYMSIFVSLGAGFFNPTGFGLFVALVLVKAAGEMLLMWPGTRILHKPFLRKYILPASLLQLIVVVMAVVFGVFGKFNWKGQKFRRRI